MNVRLRGGGDVRNSQLISAKDFPIQIHPVIVIDKSNIYEGSKLNLVQQKIFRFFVFITIVEYQKIFL